MKTPNYVFDDELYHHGILGQRWGHRRFQNEDGSWTPEGRERYGEGEGPRKAAKPKVDARAKARASFEEKKYKMYMKSKEQRLKDKIAAKEERNRVREAAKTQRLLKKEQSKVEQQGRSAQIFGKTKKMSDDDLQSAINRLKLEAEYNKSYAIASKPNGALARADRFFEGPTGKVVRDIAVATIPNVANTVATKMLDSRLKYANKLDREKMQADIDKVKADAENSRAKANQSAATAEKSRADIAREDKKADAEILLNRKKHQLEVAKARVESDRADKKLADESKRADEKQKEEFRRVNDIHERDMRKRDLDYNVEQAKQFGINKEMKQKYGDNTTGKVYTELAKQAGERNIASEKAGAQLRAIQSGRDYETMKQKQELESRKMAYDRAMAIDDDLRSLVREGKISGDTFAKTITSVSFGDTVASISRSQNPVVKDIANTITKNDFSYLTPARESAIKSANGTIEEIAKRFGVSPSTVSRIRS